MQHVEQGDVPFASVQEPIHWVEQKPNSTEPTVRVIQAIVFCVPQLGKFIITANADNGRPVG